ncbi:MAG: polysaccharide biosynthesis/export family protein [Pseudomonadota bacterium]
MGATRGQAYRIGAHDKLDVSVFKVPDLSKSLDVSDAGSINFPLLGDVRVEGDTTREVEATLKRRLEARYLQNAQVTVQVSQFNSQRVTLDGAFKRPGVYPLRGRMTLLQAVAGAEGLTDSASEEILVFRAVSGKRAAAKFSIGAIRAGSSKDPVLQAGDVVIANTSSTKQAFKNLSKVLPIARFLLLL